MFFTITPKAEVDTVVEELPTRFGGVAKVISAEIEPTGGGRPE
jgi:hypothetical protein